MAEKHVVRILIAAHKFYRMPIGEVYLPIQVGASGKDGIGFQRDDMGENISEMNPYYCELTGLYWGWKNLCCDYLGLAHYRRHFSLKKSKDKWDAVLKDFEAETLCDTFDIILPHKRHYVIESLESHYSHTHDGSHLAAVKKIIDSEFSDFSVYYTKTLKQTSGYMFNMYLMKKSLSDEYCSFLFDILKRLETEINYKELPPFEARVFGRISEILFNVWLNKRRAEDPGLRVKEIGYVHMEDINWLKKGTAFLSAKFLNKKYESSF